MASLPMIQGGGDLNADLLYENHSLTPTEGFTLNVDSSKYSKVLVIVGLIDSYPPSYYPYGSSYIEHGYSASPNILIWIDGIGYAVRGREFTWANNVLTVGNGYYLITSTSQQGYGGGLMIPYEIYGIKN